MHMRSLQFGLLALVTACAGCQQLSLRNHTERQATTLSDLQYRQVLDNLALFVDNANALPFFSAAGTGLTNINLAANGSGTFNWDLFTNGGLPTVFHFDKSAATVGGSATSIEQWNTASVLNPDELLLMRCIYQKVVGFVGCDCDCEKKLLAYFKGQPCYLEAMHPGWFGVGPRHAVPKHTAYVGHHGHTYVWVMPEGVDDLTRITLAVLDLATAAAPFTIPDATAGAIKKLTDRAKDLSDILSKYPKGEPPSPGYLKLKTDLDNTMVALAIAIDKDAATKFLAAAPDKTFKMGTLSLEGSKYEEVHQVLQAAQTPLELEFRPRKNLYNPLQLPLTP
jgi:hypothetical protein